MELSISAIKSKWASNCKLIFSISECALIWSLRRVGKALPCSGRGWKFSGRRYVMWKEILQILRVSPSSECWLLAQSKLPTVNTAKFWMQPRCSNYEFTQNLELTFSCTFYLCIDRNCIRILVAKNMMQDHPAYYIPGEYVVHISRDFSLVQSDFIDSFHPVLNEDNVNGRGSKFACRLRDETNHTCDSYTIDVVLRSRYFLNPGLIYFSMSLQRKISSVKNWINIFMNLLCMFNTCHDFNLVINKNFPYDYHRFLLVLVPLLHQLCTARTKPFRNRLLDLPLSLHL